MSSRLKLSGRPIYSRSEQHTQWEYTQYFSENASRQMTQREEDMVKARVRSMMSEQRNTADLLKMSEFV